MFQDANQSDVSAFLNENPPSYALEFSQPNAMRFDTYSFGVQPTNGHFSVTVVLCF